MMLPGIIVLSLFFYKPLYGLLIAFKDYKIKLGVTGSPWADNYGMQWFIMLFRGSQFGTIMRNTMVISALSLALSMPSTIILALLLNELRGVVFKRIVQTITYLPHFFSWVIVGGIFKTMFSITGPINAILNDMGMETFKFLENDTAFFVLLMVSRVWKGVGWGAIIYIAALAGVDEALAKGADIIVLCSSDDEYATLAPKAYKYLAGRAEFVVAGAPACTEDLKAVGINDYVHVRCNVLETLRDFNNRLLK